ncbi:hypothetical protein CC78DRAFT_580045 [Lojkania enalia]|uniref:Uncharacterized protein n=1 Tax=Lojkania enalia TaxID=147567 RepID=A0A9P4K8P3_9PLEO|nr:hypothetical protein CC78DRAFT_580045 [Didymosphaeria enalia]
MLHPLLSILKRDQGRRRWRLIAVILAALTLVRWTWTCPTQISAPRGSFGCDPAPLVSFIGLRQHEAVDGAAGGGQWISKRLLSVLPPSGSMGGGGRDHVQRQRPNGSAASATEIASISAPQFTHRLPVFSLARRGHHY